MVGKFNLDLGDDYAFDPRRAKEVAEGASGGGSTGTANPNPIQGQSGPYEASNGLSYFLGEGTLTGQCWIGYDVVGDPAPDAWQPLQSFVNNGSIDAGVRQEVQDQADAIGCGS